MSFSRRKPRSRSRAGVLAGILAAMGLAVLGALLMQGAGQAPQQQEVTPQEKPPTFKLQVQRNLVLVRAVVRDDKGRAVGGLRKEDFKLLDNGKVQAITHFSAETPATPPAREVKPAPPKTEPESAAPPAPSAITRWRYLGLFFDDSFLPFEHLARARNAADRFLATALTPSDRAGVFTSSGRTTLDFTGDRAKLHEALFKLRPVNPGDSFPPGQYPFLLGNPRGDHIPSQTEYLALLRLQNMEQLVRRMGTLPGQRNLIMISDGFGISPWELKWPSLAGEMVDRALRSNVIISSLDPKGLPILLRETDASWPGAPDGGPMVAAMHMGDSSREFGASSEMAELAKDTGGEFFHHDNDLEAGFAKVAATPEVYYSLAFSAQNLKHDGSFHSLKVELVHNAGLSVVARRGYFEPRRLPGAEGQVNEEIQEVSFTLDELKELPVDVHTQYSQSANGEAQLSVHAHLDIRTLRFRREQDRNANEVMFVTVLFDRDGKYADGKWQRVTLRLSDSTQEKLLASGINRETSFAVKPGTYLIREVVQDSEEGHLAAVNSIVEIPF